MDADKRAVKILDNHKKKLKDSVLETLGDLNSYGTSAEILEGMIDGAITDAIFDNEERIPEYYSVYHEFTDIFRRMLGYQVGIEMNLIMKKIDSLRNEASKESRTEGRINAYKEVQPKIEIDASTLPPKFRK